jgi:cell division protein FtsZ
MKSTGEAMIGTGVATGENRAIRAVEEALSNPILEDINIDGAKNVLVNIASNGNIGMHEIASINEAVIERAGERSNFIFGVLDDKDLDEEIMVTVIATGFRKEESEMADNNDITMRVAEGYDLGNIGKITALPTDLISLKELDKPAVERRYNKVIINDDLSENDKPNIAKKIQKYGFDDTEKNVVDPPAFLRRSLD